MGRQLRTAVLATAVVLPAGCTTGGSTAKREQVPAPAATSSAASQQSAPAELAEVGPFVVELDNREGPATGPGSAGQVSWESTWRLSWTPVPGATSYAISYGTNEGRSDKPATLQTATFVRVQAAAGTSPSSRLEKDRKAGLLFTSSQLLVSVSARGSNGEGPGSLWFPVGDVPPDGRPRGSAEIGDHDS